MNHDHAVIFQRSSRRLRAGYLLYGLPFFSLLAIGEPLFAVLVVLAAALLVTLPGWLFLRTSCIVEPGTVIVKNPLSTEYVPTHEIEAIKVSGKRARRTVYLRTNDGLIRIWAFAETVTRARHDWLLDLFGGMGGEVDPAFLDDDVARLQQAINAAR